MPRPALRHEDRAFAKSLGEAIRAVRRSKGIKAEAFAFDVGVSPQTLSCWELGKALPYLPHLLKVSEVLGVRMSRLVATTERLLWVREAQEDEGNND